MLNYFMFSGHMANGTMPNPGSLHLNLTLTKLFGLVERIVRERFSRDLMSGAASDLKLALERFDLRSEFDQF